MSLLHEMRTARESTSVALTDFIIELGKNKDPKNSNFCFYEGKEDRIYYARIIRLKTKSKLYDYVPGGRDEVIKIHQIIKNNKNYNNVKIGYFIDNDFHLSAVSEDIYVTPCYSIENLYCSSECIESILITEFSFERSSNDLSLALNLYKKLRSDFLNQITILNYWLFYYQNNIYKNGKDRLFIDRTLRNIFENCIDLNLELKQLEEINTLEKIEKLFKIELGIIEEDLISICNKSFQVERYKKYRGKFMLSFMVSFFDRIQKIMGTNNNPFEKKYSCKLRVEIGTACSTFSQYSHVPDCLDVYISHYLN